MAPIPVITALGFNSTLGPCQPLENGIIWEFTPFEFGSRDPAVEAFMKSQFLGTETPHGPYLGNKKLDGQPQNSNCSTGFDNLGFIMGISFDIFNTGCSSDIPKGYLPWSIRKLTRNFTTSEKNEFSLVPNPFRSDHRGIKSKYDRRNQHLTLVDGGKYSHNSPIIPLLEPSRGVDVILLSDTDDSSHSNKSERFAKSTLCELMAVSELVSDPTHRLHHRMPRVPRNTDHWAKLASSKEAVVFGSGEGGTVTIVYLPNTASLISNDKGSTKRKYTPQEIEATIAQGVEMVTQNGDSQWAECLAYFIRNAGRGTVPVHFWHCGKRYYWNISILSKDIDVGKD